MFLKRMIVKNIYLLCMFLLVTGCAQNFVFLNKELKNDVKGKGLLVGHFSTSRTDLVVGEGRLRINSKNYYNAIDNSQIVIPLEPGEYVLQEAESSTNNEFRSNRNMLYSLDIKFTIREGEITNLGEIFLLFEKGSWKYKYYLLKNDKDIMNNLASDYSGVYKKFRNKRMNYAKGKYLDLKNLNELRRLSSVDIVEKRQIGAVYVAGALGGIAKVKDGTVKWIDTGSLQYLDTCNSSSEKLACVIRRPLKGDLLFSGTKNKHQFRKLPTKNFKGKIYLGDKDNILLVDEEMELFSSANDGKSWVRDSSYKYIIPENVKPEKIKVEVAPGGYYLYSSRTGILLKRYNRELRRVHQPENRDLISMISTENGLYIKTSGEFLASASQYVKKHKSDDWQSIDVPDSKCFPMLSNYSRDELFMVCKGETYTVSNAASKWVKRERK